MKNERFWGVWISAAGLLFAIAQPRTADAAEIFSIASPAFPNGGMIPKPHSLMGGNVSPPLEWRGVPDQAKTLALIMDDPDAPSGTWDHWLIYNIPAQAKGLKEGIAKVRELPDGSRQGVNSWGRIGYDGPNPPSGTHRYYFRLYALDCDLGLPAGANKTVLLSAMKGHILATAELMGRYR